MERHRSSDPKVWICEGTCKAEVADDEHAIGQHCATQGCDQYGETLKERYRCADCDLYYKDEEVFEHQGEH